QGQRVATLRARDYAAYKPKLLAPVLESFARLAARHDLVIAEGAGSPAEINLRDGDIANMGFARAANVPVVLAGDIDRGGVIAQLVGTQAVLAAADAALVRGFIVNKFRGDPRLFDEGYQFIETRTLWRGFGVVPWFADAAYLPGEDAQDLRRARPVAAVAGGAKIAVLVLSRIANFDDLDPLRAEPGVELCLVGEGEAIPGDAALVIIPGSKSTRGDLAFLRAQGWDIDLLAHKRRGGMILGLCGGYQMLGREVADPDGIEGPPGTMPGLGLLDISTRMEGHKELGLVQAVHEESGLNVDGYEIHLGRSGGPDQARPFARIGGRPEGAVSADGKVMGSYLHGLFGADAFRAAFLAKLGAPSATRHQADIEAALDGLADHLEAHLNIDGLLDVADAR
ncbi:MAG TPA: cobyric acid synthase, partial [Acidocella sp.]|nr:cobyric acid synthase [Acidocella sp.]